MTVKKSKPDDRKLDRIVAEARRNSEQRAQTYRERALKIHPWICARCGREFTRANLQLLTVHHRDHDHDNNPPDGSNWELLCVYCHENEHSRYLDHVQGAASDSGSGASVTASHKPFADLEARLKGKK